MLLKSWIDWYGLYWPPMKCTGRNQIFKVGRHLWNRIGRISLRRTWTLRWFTWTVFSHTNRSILSVRKCGVNAARWLNLHKSGRLPQIRSNPPTRNGVLSANLPLLFPVQNSWKFDQISPNASISGACSITRQKWRKKTTYSAPEWTPVTSWRRNDNSRENSLASAPSDVTHCKSRKCLSQENRWPSIPKVANDSPLDGLVGRMECAECGAVFLCRSRSITVDTVGQSVTEQPAARGQRRSGRYVRSVWKKRGAKMIYSGRNWEIQRLQGPSFRHPSSFSGNSVKLRPIRPSIDAHFGEFCQKNIRRGWRMADD